MNAGNDEQARRAHEVYRKLLYFFEHQVPVHFSIMKNGVKVGWKNGLIRDLNQRTLTLVIREFEDGVLPMTCEEVDPASIKEYTPRKAAVEVSDA